MNKQVKWILAALAFISLMIAAAVLYHGLSKRVQPNSTQTTAAQQTTEEAQTELSVPVTDAGDEPLSVPVQEDAPQAEKPSVTVPEPTKPEPTKPEPTKPEPTQPAPTQPQPTQPQPTQPQPTQPAPQAELAADFTVLDKNGNQTKLSEHFGKPLVVNFWASWCGPCRSELPAFDAAAKAHAGEMEFMMVNLTDGYSETVEGVNQFITENGYTFPVYYDTEESASKAYSIYSIPLTVFIRADGTVLDSHIGSMDEATLQSYLDRLAG